MLDMNPKKLLEKNILVKFLIKLIRPSLIEELKREIRFLPFIDEQNIVTRGHYAQQLIENPLFNEIYGKIEQELIEAWKKSPIRDFEGREKLFMRMEALEKIKSIIQYDIANARYEQDIYAKRNTETKSG